MATPVSPLPQRDQVPDGKSWDDEVLAARARTSLLVLLVTFLLVQPLTIALGSLVAQRLEAGKDTQTQWRQFVGETRPPDVLFIGDSRVRADVDATTISRLLSAHAGHSMRSARLGISGASPAFIDTLLYQVTRAQAKPRRIVLAVSEYEFNANYNPDPSYDLWQISSFDPGFISLAIRRDPNPGRLIRGWLVPAFANAQLITQGAQCVVQRIHGIDLCSQMSRFPEDQVMTPAAEDYILGLYRELHLANYTFSEQKLAYLREALQKASAAGIPVHLVILPVYKIDALNPAAYQRFLAALAELAAQQGVHVTDLHQDMQHDLTFWGDPSHLNHAGAGALASRLAIVAEQ
jgi:hypothetical protein